VILFGWGWTLPTTLTKDGRNLSDVDIFNGDVSVATRRLCFLPFLHTKTRRCDSKVVLLILTVVVDI